MNSRPKISRLASLFLAHACATALCIPHASAQAVKPADPVPSQRTQTPVPQPSEVQMTAPAIAAAPKDGEEEIVKLGTFEVTSRRRGYYQDTTMAGTRIGSKIEDLGASITVVTVEQMDDFGLLDINDIFNFEVSAEGASTFTDISVDINGQVTDGNMNSPETANRIRALGTPNRAFANFETSRLPTDRLLISSLELIRGPSSIIAGLGNPAGTYVINPATPHLTTNSSGVRMRVDSDNSFRQTLDLSRVLIKNKLAIRAQQLYSHQGYQRKPSGMNTEMYNFLVKYKPFKNTTVDAIYVRHKSFGNRPNSVTPGDGITPWLTRGEYTFDPMQPNTGSYNADDTINPTAAQGAVYDRNGNMIVGTPNSNYLTNNGGLGRLYQTSGRGNTLFLIDRDGTAQMRAMRPTDDGLAGSPNPASTDWRLHYPAMGAYGNYQSGYGYVIPSANPIHDPNLPTPIRPNNRRGINNKNLYDWSSININATDHYYSDVNAMMVRLTQTLIDTQEQYLALELGWFREDSDQVTKSLGGTGAAASYLTIDVNRTLLDGSDNPNYLRPYLMVNQDVVTDTPLLNDTYRAQLAYRVDFRQNKNWTRWLGQHSFTGFAEYKHYETRRHRYRHAITSDHYWAPAGTPRATTGTGNGANTGNLWDQTSRAESRLYLLYYVGDSVGYNIDYSPGKLSPGRYDIIWGNAVTGDWKNEPAALGLAGDLQTSFGTNNNMRLTKGGGGVLQSHFLDDGLVTTFGYRRDSVHQKDGVPPRMMPDGINFDWAYNNRWNAAWTSNNSGSTLTKGVVVKPAAWISPDSPKWLRPLRHISFFYNEASSLDLNVTQAFNLKGENTPNPTGKGKDYGVRIQALNGRLIINFNRYENYTRNQRGNGNMATVTNRMLSFDIYESNYEMEEEDLDWSEAGTSNRAYGLNLQATNWVKHAAMLQGEILTDDETFLRVADIMKMTPERLDTLQRNRTRIYEPDNGEAKGYELSVNWEATNFLAFRLGGSRQSARNVSLAQGYLDYIDERWDFWQNLKDPITGQNWMTTAYPTPAGGTGSSALSYYNGNIRDQWEFVKAQIGLPLPTVSKYSGFFQTRLDLRGITDHRVFKNMSMTASVRYQTPTGIGNTGMDLGRYDSNTGTFLYGSDDPANYDNVHDIMDPNAIVYGKNIATLSFGLTYKTVIFGKVRATFQLNANNLLENGGIRALRTDSNGIATVYRIVDPRTFTFEARFDF